MRWPGAAYAIAAALLFGVSTPIAKVLLGNGLSPQLLAGLLYLGSGVGLTLMLIGRIFLKRTAGESNLRLSDMPQLASAVLLGGAVAPVLLMEGLVSTEATAASLLLNLEGLATMGIAWLFYRENVDRRLLLGAFAILIGAVLLSWSNGPLHFGTGSLLIAGACLAWGADNNLTRGLSNRDPLQIAAVKGLLAGTTNLTIAFYFDASVPSIGTTAAAGVVGFLGYGVSLVLFVLGLRHLGTARTAAYFSTAPFVGAILAVAMLSEPLSIRLLLAGILMAFGLYLHLRESHSHAHEHAAMEHEHRHIHDAHHQHAHEASAPPGEPHSHRHRHEPMAHEHPHYPDLHHRHDH